MAAPVSMHYEINQEDVIMSRDALMCRWTMRTVSSPTHPPTHPSPYPYNHPSNSITHQPTHPPL